MSLPIPTARQSNNPRMDPRQLQAMDAPLIALTQQCKGDLRQLMYSFFSFLNRRTDLYMVPHPDDVGKHTMGFAEGDAEKMLIAAFRQFPLRRIPKGGPQANPKANPKASQPTKSNATKKGSAPSSKQVAAKAKVEKPPKVAESSSSPDNKTTKENLSAKKESSESNDKDDDDDDSVPPNMKGVRYNEEGLQIPIGNGGSTPRYKWTQTIDETTVLIAVPKDFRGKDYSVSITASRLSVKAKRCLPGDDKPITFLEGKLVDTISVDESTWSVEGGIMTVTLDKKAKKFWTAVLEEDIEKYKIDTEVVDSRRRIDEYDDATQAHFRKMIFDQNQYHLGGPTADEILGKAKKPSNIPGLPPGVEYKEKTTSKSSDSNSRSSSSSKSETPALPPGVEYIDKKTLDEAEKGKK
eukprot:CAMPEP_0116135084 /NCGR_PEP_ID=MMETSP0329-20121206/11001_1 /TAXON_ID=697910 /ORGANISM="Pseudo-nitzschia arenysensis, Strain B593" /LENGTH=408 /DNA_ID=CAMNT_0003629859 /DNA_START=33 /DNA_END=1259 /DNA_ORIENTATION=-